MKKITIKVITRLQDNGDGGYTMYVYNNEDELIKNHPLSKDWKVNPLTNKYEEMGVVISDELRREILEENDPYRNGYISHDTIEILVDGDNITLAEPMQFHAGQ